MSRCRVMQWVPGTCITYCVGVCTYVAGLFAWISIIWPILYLNEYQTSLLLPFTAPLLRYWLLLIYFFPLVNFLGWTFERNGIGRRTAALDLEGGGGYNIALNRLHADTRACILCVSRSSSLPVHRSLNSGKWHLKKCTEAVWWCGCQVPTYRTVVVQIFAYLCNYIPIFAFINLVCV